MKKYIAIILALCCVFALAGCDNKMVNIDFPFEAADVENIEIYHFVSPAEAKKKVVMESEDIEGIYRTFESISLNDKKTEFSDDDSVTSFRFNLSDATSYEVTYTAVAVKSGRIITTDMEQALFTAADIESSWENSDYEAVPAEESELPHYNK